MTPLRFGMIGGGKDAFIGAVHRTAAVMDGRALLAAGCLGSTPDRALVSGKALGLSSDRNYPTWQAMLDAESKRSDRLDFVSIVTPNDTHAPIAHAFLRAGFNTVLDKPMTRTLDEAVQLASAAQASRSIFAVTYNYTGYPLVREAAEIVRAGRLGPIRKVVVEYHQGWLATDLAAQGQKQASWRADPARAGAGVLGDIGTHAENLASFVTGLRLSHVLADVSTLVPSRRIDDDAAVLLRFEGGARGVLSVSQVAAGEENNLSLRVYGQDASLAWRQESPNELVLMPRDGRRTIITRAGPGAGPAAMASTRLPSGHPEGFLEAFANVYRSVFERIRAARENRTPAPHAALMPTALDGLRGIRFIDAALRSSRESRWIPIDHA